MSAFTRSPLPFGLLCLFGLAAGCGLFQARPAGPPEPAVTPEQQMHYARAESRLNSPEAAVRRQAAVALLAMDHPRALPAVLQRLRKADDASVRASMVQAAAFSEDPRCFEAVLEAVEDPAPEVRREAARALARFTAPGQVDAIMSEAAGADPERRRLLYRALGQGLAIRAVPVLLDGLEADQEPVRTAAWEAMRRISGRQFPPDPEPWRQWWEANRYKSREDVLEERLQTLAASLDARSEELNELAEQQQELLALVKSPEAETPDQLLEALGSRYNVVKQYAAFRLSSLSQDQLAGVSIDDKESYALLSGALADGSEHVRRSVLNFVLGVGGEYRSRLIRQALHDESAEVLTLAIGAVDGSMGPEVVTRLEELLRSSPHAAVREAAANTLGKIGAQGSVPALVAALDDPAENVRWFAVEGLRKLGATQALPRVTELLQQDENARVREIAAGTLGELGQPAAVPALRRALQDPNERVRQKAGASLLMLAAGSYERMKIIADAFREQELYGTAQEVLRKAVDTYRADEGMQARVAEAFEALAEVQGAQEDYAASAATYQELDEFLGGQPQARRNAVDGWLLADEPSRAVAALQRWFEQDGAEPGPELLELALSTAERLLEQGNEQDGAAVLELVKAAVGEEADEELKARIARLEGRQEPQ